VDKLSERTDKIEKRFSEIRELMTRLLDESMKFYRREIRITVFLQQVPRFGLP